MRLLVSELIVVLRQRASVGESWTSLACRTNEERADAADQMEEDQHLIRQLRAENIRLKLAMEQTQSDLGQTLRGMVGLCRMGALKSEADSVQNRRIGDVGHDDGHIERQS